MPFSTSCPPVATSSSVSRQPQQQTNSASQTSVDQSAFRRSRNQLQALRKKFSAVFMIAAYSRAAKFCSVFWSARRHDRRGSLQKSTPFFLAHSILYLRVCKSSEAARTAAACDVDTQPPEARVRTRSSSHTRFALKWRPIEVASRRRRRRQRRQPTQARQTFGIRELRATPSSSRR